MTVTVFILAVSSTGSVQWLLVAAGASELTGGLSFAEAVSRFNANVSYSGLTHAVTQEHLFAENKEKLIHSALQVVEPLSIITLQG